ncbi:unnamed protein product (macronuclear) [Paramecium tetraurelia]|uniref:MIR domain-containing protein n=1 Tax=Paramecium tetraurelia TaxID=5888 RepID=A0C014_PARTE|nr:uncharacterized protein GSPATT00005984001 [Paramecium tetraurelia]CAK64131.1 unnamed protein product [Paramecium tetraurelia]|eukprot:XP_001431529.1 hypothetical protein (macronuclear) [Paramecium tetraurelia strain d4-2]
MGNCIKEYNNHSSLQDCPRKEIFEQDFSNLKACHRRKKSRLLSQVQSIVIKEDPETEQDQNSSFELNSQFQIEQSATINLIRFPQGLKMEKHHQIKLYNLHTQRYLHSHAIKHEHNKSNEVSTCNNCNYEYDWWQIIWMDNKTYVYHPITQSYLKCLQTINNMGEVGCLQNDMDEWEIIADDEEIKQYSIIKLKHICTGLYLHTQPYQSKIENQHIVSVCKPEVANALWRITDMQ